MKELLSEYMRHFTFGAMMLALFTIVGCEPVTYDVFSAIAGKVVDKDTMEPLVGAEIALNPSSKDALMTEENGYFEFLNLESDTQYTLIIQKSGYESNFKTLKTIAGETHNVTITLKKLD